MSLQTLSSGEHVRREPFLTVLGTHSISRSLALPPQRMPARPPAAPAAAGPAPHAHPAVSKRSRNQTPHAHAACCVSVTLHRMRVAGILWKRLAVGRAVVREVHTPVIIPWIAFEATPSSYFSRPGLHGPGSGNDGQQRLKHRRAGGARRCVGSCRHMLSPCARPALPRLRTSCRPLTLKMSAGQPLYCASLRPKEGQGSARQLHLTNLKTANTLKLN